VFSDGVDSIIDGGIGIIVFLGLRFMTKDYDYKISDGYARLENLMSLFAALSMLGTGVFIGYMSYERLANNVFVSFSFLGLGIICVSGVISLILAILLTRIASVSSLNSLKTGALNASKDFFSSLIVGIMLVFVWGGLYFMDAVGGLILSGIICFLSYISIREEAMVLIDIFDNPALLQRIQTDLSNMNGIKILSMTPRKAGPYITVNIQATANPGMTLTEVGVMKLEIERIISGIIPNVKSVLIDFRPDSY
jgi:cation diffusion facilitator family transporter